MMVSSWLRRHIPAADSGRDILPSLAETGRRTDAPCSVAGCRRDDRVVCDYVDRRGAACLTAWCPDHVLVVGRSHLCRRHARLVRALAPREFGGDVYAPDRGNRSPSLAAFLAENLQREVSTLLGEQVRPELGERYGEEPLTLVTIRMRLRRWTCAWKVYDSTGPVLRVSVEVDEQSDPECTVRLNGRTLVHCVPPWIEARRPAGPETAQPGVSGVSAEAFCADLVRRHIRPAVEGEAARNRTLGTHTAPTALPV